MAATTPQFILFACLLLLTLCNHGGAMPLPAQHNNTRSSTAAADSGSHWVQVWAATAEAIIKEGDFVSFQDATVRQTFPISLGARQIRITLSNEYGLSELPVGKVTVALATADENEALEDRTILGSGSIDTESLHDVTFASRESVNIPKDGSVVSDDITFDPPLVAGQILSVSIYLPSGEASFRTTSHEYSQTTSAIAHGDQTSSASISTTGHDGLSWYFVTSIDAWTDSAHVSFVIAGDSITDGRYSPVNKDLKWPSMLRDRFQTDPRVAHISVINQGSGGNQVVSTAHGPILSQASLVDRLRRDVLDSAGLRYVMIFEGINDIGDTQEGSKHQRIIAKEIIRGYREIISEVHAQGLPVIAATLTPFGCPADHDGKWNSAALRPMKEVTRQAVNDWIRNSGAFDHVLDFDEILRDPQDPSVTAPAFIGSDCLHPNVEGMRAMMEAFPLDIFSKLDEIRSYKKPISRHGKAKEHTKADENIDRYSWLSSVLYYVLTLWWPNMLHIDSALPD